MVSYRHKDRKNRMEQNRIQKYVREVGKKIVANLKTTKHKRKIINHKKIVNSKNNRHC